jgi:hypothetical protein
VPASPFASRDLEWAHGRNRAAAAPMALDGAQIAESVGVSRATGARSLGQLGLARLGPAEPVTPGRRYEWAQARQLMHLDIKKLGRMGRIEHRITGDRRARTRGIGWEFVHVCIDDCSRVAYAEVLPDERAVTVAGFLRRALTWFARRGVVVQRILTDNGSAYRSQPARCPLPRSAPGPALDAPLHTPHQWRSRALHPDAAARVGLRRRVGLLGAPHRRPRALGALLQLASTPQRP